MPKLIQTLNVIYWKLLNLRKNILYIHDLNDQSIVFDIGGYTGVFSDKIIALYNPYMYIFEPVNKFYTILKEKYANNKKIKVFEYGLSNKTKKEKISIEGDKSSFHTLHGNFEEVSLIDINEFFKRKNIAKVDLMSINIEGGEYALLERLIKSSYIKNINFIQVQFHTIGTDYSLRRKKIINSLKKTHDNYLIVPYVWEFFKLKN